MNLSESKRNNSVIHFFYKLAAFIVFILLLDFTVGIILRYLYFKQESGLLYRTTYAIETTTADILIFGSSRANHHYHPDIFKDSLKMDYYNVGRDGNFIFYNYAVLKCILNRHKPEIIILDFVEGEFAENQTSYDRLSSLLPYYRDHPEIRPIIELKGPFEKLKLLSSVYPFNSSLLTILAGISDFNKTRKNDQNGYLPLNKTWDYELENERKRFSYPTDSIKISYYKSFIKDCANSGIQLYVICSPYYILKYQEDLSISLGKEIAEKYKVTFLDYSDDNFFLDNRKLFADINHLNDQGALEFSEKVIDEIIKTNGNVNQPEESRY